MAEGVLGEKAELLYAVLCSGCQLLRHIGIPMVSMGELGLAIHVLCLAVSTQAYVELGQ